MRQVVGLLEWWIKLSQDLCCDKPIQKKTSSRVASGIRIDQSAVEVVSYKMFVEPYGHGH